MEQVPVPCSTLQNQMGPPTLAVPFSSLLRHATRHTHRSCDCRQYADKQLNQPFPGLTLHYSPPPWVFLALASMRSLAFMNEARFFRVFDDRSLMSWRLGENRRRKP